MSKTVPLTMDLFDAVPASHGGVTLSRPERWNWTNKQESVISYFITCMLLPLWQVKLGLDKRASAALKVIFIYYAAPNMSCFFWRSRLLLVEHSLRWSLPYVICKCSGVIHNLATVWRHLQKVYHHSDQLFTILSALRYNWAHVHDCS